MDANKKRTDNNRKKECFGNKNGIQVNLSTIHIKSKCSVGICFTVKQSFIIIDCCYFFFC